VTDSARWLAERLAEAPPGLRGRIEEALAADRAANSVQGAADQAFDDELRGVAEDLLAAATAGPPTHETALTLLAADALITLACEWVGETEPRRLGEMR
jgi:hypothetical protein